MNAASLQHLARRLGPVGLAAVLCGLGASVVMILSSSTLLSAAAVPSATLVEQAEKERKENEDKFKLAFDGHLKQINGRSLFLTPSAPPPKEQPRPVVADEGPKEPPKPTSYGGPGLIAMINGVAWFNDGKKLAPGEGDAELKMLELKPPWGARVKWKDVEFTVGLFDRDSIVNPPPKPAKPPEPAEAMMGPEAPPDAFPPSTPAKPPETKPGDKPAEAPPPPALPPRPPEQAAGTEPAPLPPPEAPPAPPPQPAQGTPPESR